MQTGYWFIGIRIATVDAIQAIGEALILRKLGLGELPVKRDLIVAAILGVISEKAKRGLWKDQGYYIVKIGGQRLK